MFQPKEEEEAEKLPTPNLPKDVIDKTLHPEKYERPVLFKCKHIADIHKKEHYPIDRLPRRAGLVLVEEKWVGEIWTWEIVSI